ncbi:MAG: PorT family protein [Bacteroidetes bacterium]|nr:PorT family protein [Bacteroidota bacterium]
MLVTLFGNVALSQERVDPEILVKDTEFIFSVTGDTPLSSEYRKQWGYNIWISNALFTDDIFNVYYGGWFSLSRIRMDSVKTYVHDKYSDMTYTFNSAGLIPFLFRVNMGNKFRFYIEAGFSFEYYFDVHEHGIFNEFHLDESDYSYYFTSEIISRQVYDFKRFDLGMNTGAGLIVAGKKAGVKLGGNYHTGAFNILLDQNYYITDLHNSYWMISLGIFFRRYKEKKGAKF